MTTEKSKDQMYAELMHFINYCHSVDTLKDMLIETIDNCRTDYYTQLHRDYSKQIEDAQF